MTNPIEPDPGTLERFIRFFSYFTILTNIIVAVTLTSLAFVPRSKLGRITSHGSVQTAVAVYISIVGMIYTFFLRSVWDPAGWQAVADHALHDAVPVLYVIYWLAFSPKSGVDWNDPIKWLAYPAAYLIYSLARGAAVGWYPYWFADVTQLGYPAALTNAAFVMAGFALVGILFAAMAKLLSRTAITAPN